jgi:hypothetical protein
MTHSDAPVNTDWPALVIGVILLAVLAGAGLYDLYVSVTGYQRPTVSEVIRDWGTRFPPLLIAVGILIGHLFWPGVRPPKA